MKTLFIILALAGVGVFYFEQRSKAAQAGITPLPIGGTPAQNAYDQLLQQTLMPQVSAGQIVNTGSTKPYAEADPSLPGGILVSAGT